MNTATADGDHVAMVRTGRMVGAHTADYLGVAATGREVSVENCEIYQFDRDDGGLVSTTWSYGDPVALFRQLGAVPGEEPEAS